MPQLGPRGVQPVLGSMRIPTTRQGSTPNVIQGREGRRCPLQDGTLILCSGRITESGTVDAATADGKEVILVSIQNDCHHYKVVIHHAVAPR